MFGPLELKLFCILAESLARCFGDALVPPMPFVLALLAFGVHQLFFRISLGAGAAEHHTSVLQRTAKNLVQSIDAAVDDFRPAELSAAWEFVIHCRSLTSFLPAKKPHRDENINQLNDVTVPWTRVSAVEQISTIGNNL